MMDRQASARLSVYRCTPGTPASIKVAYAGGAGAAAPPLNGGLRIAVEEGALLRLDYIGTNRVEEVRIAGRSHVGVVSAAACPELGHALSGAGALFVQPRGTVLLLR